MLVIICTWKSQRMGTSNLTLVLINWTWGCTTFHNFISMLKKKKIKSWQVCDWLAKWFIMSGYMDLRRPRVYRRSNVGLVKVRAFKFCTVWELIMLLNISSVFYLILICLFFINLLIIHLLILLGTLLARKNIEGTFWSFSNLACRCSYVASWWIYCLFEVTAH